MDYFATFDQFPVYEELKKNTEEAERRFGGMKQE